MDDCQAAQSEATRAVVRLVCGYPIMTRPVVIHRDALLAFDDRARLILERVVAGDTPIRTAGWLMCNPSDADALIDDPTVGRVMHHSARAGCRRSLVGNVWSLRTPYPVELWSRLAQGEYTDTMRAANLGMLASIGAQADVLFVAFGAEPWRRHRAAVMEAIGALRSASRAPVLCLGSTADGSPLHPLARGKFAVRNDCALVGWVTEW